MKNIVEITMQCSYREQGYINIPKIWWDLFPPPTTEIELEAEPMGVIHTQFYVENSPGSHHGFSTNLKPWFKAHRELTKGDTLIIEVRKTGSERQYRLLSPKEQKEVI